MKKMPCLFVRTFHGDGTFTITEEVTPGCEWVLAGEGVASRKWDGTAVMVRNGVLYARYDAKKGKAAPAGAIPCTEAPDPITGHWPHWVLANRPQDRWIREAFAASVAARAGATEADGTYEAVGPNINGNAEGVRVHLLMRHGNMLCSPPRTFSGLKEWLASHDWEGIVFHHHDGRMCKIRRDDFGLPWPVKEGA
jgi:hypothetical protein